MGHRAYLFSLRAAHAFRESCIDEAYSVTKFGKDLVAGATVGVIAIPLAMALAIASGVAPQYGLYTAIIAGFVIALTGGSRFSISGPTAAFVVILFPIAQQYGLGGLLMATVMAGVMLVLMALLRLGRLIEYIPEAVTLGFTGGIAIVIATLQIKDIAGLNSLVLPEHYVSKILTLYHAFPQSHWPSLLVAGITLAVMIVWRRLGTPIPPHLPALIVGTLVALVMANSGYAVDTIGSRFSYLLPDGTHGAGIPPVLPHFEWPWLRVGAQDTPLGLNWQTFNDLLPSAFAIAMLGAIESLLCAVVLDGVSGRRHSANSELLGQGIGNILAPLFGGITATAAIARSSANYRAGAQSPVSGMVHALVVLLGLVSLAPWLAYLPMPAMAALLVMVAWNMSELPKTIHLVRKAPKGDLWVLFTCLSLTVLFDMVIAITAGIVLAALLFMKDIAGMTKVSDISRHAKLVTEPLSPGWSVYKINGPLFFAAADRVFGELAGLCVEQQGIVLYLDGVPILDAGGLAALEKLIAQCERSGTRIYIADLQQQPKQTIKTAGMKPIEGVLSFFPTLHEALEQVPKAL